MRPVVIESEPAIRDLLATAGFLERTDPAVALRFLREARHTFAWLAERPEIGRPRRSRKRELAQIRSWPVEGFEKHLVFYRMFRNGIEIVRVIHGARDIAGLLRLRPDDDST